MHIGPTSIVDTFAEAFRMRYGRLVVTALDAHWLDAALREATGYGSSVIACDAEAGVERLLRPEESPDGRCAAEALFFGFSSEGLAKAMANRVGQCLMTCPTTAVFDGLPDAAERAPLGKHLRYFGDGLQKSKVVGGRRYWRIPVMDGEFLVEEDFGIAKGVAGGNLIIQGVSQQAALTATRRAVESLADAAGIVTPFPGGVVRSGSKVGSRYPKLIASTNDAFCPTVRGRVATELTPTAQAAYEIVINGVSESAVAEAMRCAMEAAAGEGIPAIGAGNYGGKLGKFHLHLRRL